AHRIVNEAVAVLVRSARALLHVERLNEPRAAPRRVAPDGREHLAHQLDLAPGVVGEDRLRDFGRLDARADEFGRDLEGALRRVRVMKTSGVGDESGVDALGDLLVTRT